MEGHPEPEKRGGARGFGVWPVSRRRAWGSNCSCGSLSGHHRHRAASEQVRIGAEERGRSIEVVSASSPLIHVNLTWLMQAWEGIHGIEFLLEDPL